MRYSLALTCILVALLVTAPAGVLGAGGPAPDAAAHASVQEPPRTPTPPAPADPSQVFTIRLTQDGHAEWTVESRFVLADDADAEAFTDFGDAVAAGEVETSIDAELFETYASIAASSTDREMRIENASWDDPRIEPANESDADHDVGVLTFSFRWTNFAEQREDGNQLVLGDAFQNGDGTWFRVLEDGQRLVIVRPPNYGYDQVDRAPTNGNLVWDGPHEFDEGEFDVIYLQGAGPPPDSPLWTGVIAAAVLLVLVVLGAGLSIRSSSSQDGSDSPTDGVAKTVIAVGESIRAAAEAVGSRAARTDEPATNSTEGDGTASFDEARLENSSEATAADGAVTADESASTADDEADSESDDEVDVTLLSDEERVHRLLRGNGGRMKQAMIVKETGWSNAKVSQLLSKMDADGDIEKLRIGRENLITLPEIDPTEID